MSSGRARVASRLDLPKLETLKFMGRRGYSSFHYVETFELKGGELKEVIIDDGVFPLLYHFRLYGA